MSKITKPVPKRRQSHASHNRLPLLLVLGGVVILIGALFFAFQKPAPSNIPVVTGKPSLQVDKVKVDLGNLKLGSTAFASFEIKNVGDQVLEITQPPTIQVIEGC